MISWVVSVSAAASVLGGNARLVGDLAADGAVAADKGQVVGIGPDGVGGVFPDVAYRVVGEQQCPDLLFDQFWGSGAQHPQVACLVGFDFVERQFDLSGSPGALPRRGPLRTGRAGFPRTSAQASPAGSRVGACAGLLPAVCCR